MGIERREFLGIEVTRLGINPNIGALSQKGFCFSLKGAETKVVIIKIELAQMDAVREASEAYD